MRPLDDIFATIVRHRDEILRFGVKRLGIFGSFVRGEQTPASDMDFLVDFEKKTFDSFMGLNLFLEDLFGCRVDLVITDSIRPELRQQILGEVVYVPGI